MLHGLHGFSNVHLQYCTTSVKHTTRMLAVWLTSHAHNLASRAWHTRLHCKLSVAIACLSKPCPLVATRFDLSVLLFPHTASAAGAAAARKGCCKGRCGHRSSGRRSGARTTTRRCSRRRCVAADGGRGAGARAGRDGAASEGLREVGSHDGSAQRHEALPVRCQALLSVSKAGICLLPALTFSASQLWRFVFLIGDVAAGLAPDRRRRGCCW